MSPAGPTLVVNADDFGLTPGVCAGILTAFERGIVTSTSVLVAAPAFASHAAALRDSGLGVGVHLCLVGEDPPLLSAAEVPSLVDRSGGLRPSWREFARDVLRGRVDPGDVRRELAAQITAARSAGLTIDHLDGHQHLHLMPPVATAVLALAERFDVPAVRVVGSGSLMPAPAAVRLLGARFRRRARDAGRVVPDRSAGLDHAGHLDGARLVDAIRALARTSGIADLTVHPGADPDPDRSRYRWGYQWGDELQALCSEPARIVVDRTGFTLGSYADLRAGRR